MLDFLEPFFSPAPKPVEVKPTLDSHQLAVLQQIADLKGAQVESDITLRERDIQQANQLGAMNEEIARLRIELGAAHNRIRVLEVLEFDRVRAEAARKLKRKKARSQK